MRWYLTSFAALAVLVERASAFNLYPPVNPTKLATAFNLTQGCLAALNETLADCDQTLFQMVGQFDNYYWQYDNFTTLCGGNCSTEANEWDSAVSENCDGQTITAYGKLIPATTISGRFLDGMNQVCLSSTTQDAWCLQLSYNWTGSDVVRVDCSVNPSDPSCSEDNNGTDSINTRLANLYPNSILCDNCFIDMLYQRVVSPYFPDTDQLLYLSDQLQDIGDVCNTTVPNITIRADPGYDNAPPATSTYLGTGTAPPTTVVSATPTCTGQTVAPPKMMRGVDRLAERQAAGSCNALSQQYGVTTGDLQYLTNSDNCTITSAICLPKNCTLSIVTNNQTCDTLAASIPGNFTTTQFLSWNPNILGLCDAPTDGQYVCVGAPGGTYQLAPPPLGTGANAGNQQRGGAGGNVTPTTTVTSTLNPASAGPGPTATQSGIAPGCNNYAEAKAGDDCYDFAVANGLTPAQFYSLNLILGPNGANCSLMFQASEYYCIGTASSTSAPPTSTSSVTAPGPTQSGIAANCDAFAQPTSGTGCYDFATAHGITPAQLYAWNTILGANGANCGTQFQAGEYYCIGVSGSTSGPTTTPPPTTTTPHGPTAPGPTQSGIVANCDSFAQPTAGTGCYDFATAHNITPAQLYAWNSVLGANGANCGTQFQAGEYYCVGVIPSPTQTGIVANCNSYAQPAAGTGCYDFATAHNITPAQLYQWNTVLGANGANCGTQFQAAEWYCVGVSS